MFTDYPESVRRGVNDVHRDRSGSGTFTPVNDDDPWVSPPRETVRTSEGQTGRVESPERAYDYVPNESPMWAHHAMRRAFWRWCVDNGVRHAPKPKAWTTCLCGLTFDSTDERDAHFWDMKELNECMEASHGA